ncbi:MAG: hypothetical protein ABJC51_03365 [Acidobacteriota bacterium]
MQSRHRGRVELFLGIVGSLAIVLTVAAATSRAGVLPATAGACGLITREEAARALGAPVPVGTEKHMVDVPIAGQTIKAEYCFYGSEVLLTRFELGKDAAALFNGYRQSLASRDGYQDVKGVGDEAFVAKGQLAVRKGQSGLIVDAGQARGGGAKELAAEKGLALMALGRF